MAAWAIESLESPPVYFPRELKKVNRWAYTRAIISQEGSRLLTLPSGLRKVDVSSTTP